MTELTPKAVAERLAARRPRDPVLSPRSRAGVAAILRFDAGPEVLLMQRASRPGDKWSGHVSFPGGREAPEDPDLLNTAIRETREEVGMDLAEQGQYLGRLDGVRAVARGKPLSMMIVPYVFAVSRAPALSLGDEADSAFWLPLVEASTGGLDGVYEYELGPAKWSLPCFRYRGYTVWGLTYQMLTDFLAVVDAR